MEGKFFFAVFVSIWGGLPLLFTLMTPRGVPLVGYGCVALVVLWWHGHGAYWASQMPPDTPDPASLDYLFAYAFHVMAIVLMLAGSIIGLLIRVLRNQPKSELRELSTSARPYLKMAKVFAATGFSAEEIVRQLTDRGLTVADAMELADKIKRG